MLKAPRIHVDFETRSESDLITLGEHIYASHKSTEPLMLAFGSNRNDIDLIDFFDPFSRSNAPKIPRQIQYAIDNDMVFVAHNARFEQVIWHYICHLKWGWDKPRKWSCTAARARYNGIRASLDGASSDLELQDRKDPFGKEFINTFCKPRKYVGAKKNGIIKQHWAEPHELPLMYAKGKEYCKSDVAAEIGVDEILPELPDIEQRIWELDYQMNIRGVPIDIPMVERAMQYAEYFNEKAFKRFNELIQLRPTQRNKVLEYLQQRDDIENIGDLKSKTLRRLVMTDFPEDVREIIDIRLDTTKASIKKLPKMLSCSNEDHMARGCMLYGGAHTLRWTAKRIQLHNLNRGNAKSQKLVFNLLENDNLWGLGHNGGPLMWQDDANLLFMKPITALAESMRGFIAAPKGKKLTVSDLAQIEARVLPWLAREMPLLEAFKKGRDPYVDFAAKNMYKRPYDDCFGYDSELKRFVLPDFTRPRQIGKSAVLGAGFGLGKDKFVEYCDNSDIFITSEEAALAIGAYREAHPNIVRFWGRAEAAAVMAVENAGQIVELGGTGITLYVEHYDEQLYWLRVKLPSGRCISYFRPKVRIGTKWGRTIKILSYRREWNGGSYREDTYGGKLTENWVQAIARDIIALGAMAAEAAGYPVFLIVHDEVITLCDENFGSAAELSELLCIKDDWITDLPLVAEGKEMVRYGK